MNSTYVLAVLLSMEKPALKSRIPEFESYVKSRNKDRKAQDKRLRKLGIL